jgi:hypothetical protein
MHSFGLFYSSALRPCSSTNDHFHRRHHHHYRLSIGDNDIREPIGIVYDVRIPNWNNTVRHVVLRTMGLWILLLCMPESTPEHGWHSHSDRCLDCDGIPAMEHHESIRDTCRAVPRTFAPWQQHASDGTGPISIVPL